MRLQDSIRAVLVRELRALRREIEAYPDDSTIWQTPGGINNSTGNLALHVVGNLQAFVGAVFGETGYVRDRPAEFSRQDVPRAELIREIEATAVVVDTTLAALESERLAAPYPLPFGGLRVDTGDFLIHLCAHLAFHLGQVDYHRRSITGSHRSVGPIAIPELASAHPGA